MHTDTFFISIMEEKQKGVWIISLPAQIGAFREIRMKQARIVPIRWMRSRRSIPVEEMAIIGARHLLSVTVMELRDVTSDSRDMR